MRRSVGKGIWIRDYKAPVDDKKDANSDVDEDDSRELLAKELKYIDKASSFKKLKDRKGKLVSSSEKAKDG